MARKTAEFEPQLQQAQESLEVALREACAVDVNKANTGELIHIDELLAIAGDSAKEAISVRRRMRRDAGVKSSSTKTASLKAPVKGRSSKAIPAVQGERGARTPQSRVFEDPRNVRWTIFAVRPSKATSDRANLPGPFQAGWLSFDSGTETRRLSPIPEGWHLFSDDQLRDLWKRAEVAAPRRTAKAIKPS